MTATGWAPGRVNLIGEHTDYNGGLVLPARLELGVQVQVEAAPELDLDGDGVDARSRDYASEVCNQLGVSDAARLRVRADLPPRAGLGSSAAFEVAIARALRDLHALPLDDREIALLCHRAENAFVPCGVMDQFASALAPAHGALLIDCATLETRAVPIAGGIEFAVLDSGVRHDNAESLYRERRRECEEAAGMLGVELLCRDVSGATPEVEALPEPLRSRVLHVLFESAAVRVAADALETANVDMLAHFMRGSQISQRERYEVSVPEVDALVERAEAAGALAARLTGGGWGGAVVALCNAGEGKAVAERANAPLLAIVAGV